MEQELQRIIVFDTTLRDGEQAPGASMTPGEKLLMAKQLARLGVDVIEAGFPVASESDFRAVRLIANEVRDAEVAAIARATPKDIDRAWEALAGAAHPRIHVFISSSDIHLKHQLRKSRDEVRREACAAVAHARAYTDNVELSAMDAMRSDKGFLRLMLEGAIAAGATTVNIADTVGYAAPDEFGRLVAYLLGSVAGIDRVVLSVHCHDDLGLATANSLAALRNGARQVKCTINGIGERAGNAALEEVVMALETRRDLFGLRTGVKSERLYETSRLLTSITGIGVQPNKAIVGANAFAHASGIHQDGLIKRKETYEIITPRSVGRGETLLILGRHSGSHAVRDRLLKMGYVVTVEEADRVCARVKEMAASRKEIIDEDLETILHREMLALRGR